MSKPPPPTPPLPSLSDPNKPVFTLAMASTSATAVQVQKKAKKTSTSQSKPKAKGRKNEASTKKNSSLTTKTIAMDHRYPKRIRTSTKSREAIGAKGQLTLPAAKGMPAAKAATATTAANGGGKRKKPGAHCPTGKYTKEQWEQHYKGTRCVDMKDEELTQEVLEDMTTLQLQAASASRSIRLAVGPKMFEDKTLIEGKVKERLFKNLMMFLTEATRQNAARGSNAAGFSDLKKASFAAGKCKGMTSSVDETHLHKIVNLDKHDFPMIWSKEYRDNNGGVCTALTISQSTDEEITASKGDNAAKVICDKIELEYDHGTCETKNTKATSRLRYFLKDMCKMKMDKRCVSGHKNKPGWEDGGMRFYFKGRASDIELKQTTVEPADPPSDEDAEDEESSDDEEEGSSDDEEGNLKPVAKSTKTAGASNDEDEYGESDDKSD